MTYHDLLDTATIRLTSAILRNTRFFDRSLDSPPILDVVAGASTVVEDVTTPRVFHTTVETPVGDYDAAYLPWQWRGVDYPTIVYHHGSGEDPFQHGRFATNSFRRLFVTGDPIPANVLAVRAPYHGDDVRAYIDAMGDLANFTGMLAASTALVEAIRAALADESDAPTIIAGVSLGGFVANLHRTHHDTADHYAPMIAGAALGDLFLTSAYRHLTADSARQQPDTLREVLTFDTEFAAVDTPNCTALLGRHDRIVEHDVHRPAYGDHPVTTVDTGHVTTRTADERRHVEAALDSVRREHATVDA